MALPLPGAEWSSKDKPYQIGVRARSFVPSFTKTNDARSMTNDHIL